MELDRLSDGEEAYAESIRIYKALYPSGHSDINMGKL